MALAKRITGPPLEKLEIDFPVKLKKVLIPLMESFPLMDLQVSSERFHLGMPRIYDIKEISADLVHDRSGYYHASLNYGGIRMEYEGETIISDGATLSDILLMIIHSLLCENSSTRKMLEQAENQNVLRVIVQAMVSQLKIGYKET